MLCRRSLVLIVVLALSSHGCGDDPRAEIERERAAAEAIHREKMDRIDADAKARRERREALIAKRNAAKTDEERRKAQEDLDALPDDVGARPRSTATAATPTAACTCDAKDPICPCL